VSGWQGALKRTAARLRKLRRDPVSFVDDAKSASLREAGLGSLVFWAHLADALDNDLRCATVQWGRRQVRLVRRAGPPGAAQRWTVEDSQGRPPSCWPRRVRVHVRGGDAVLSAVGEDGSFRSGALATPTRPALLSFDGVRCDLSVQFLNPEHAGELVIEPVGRAAVYHSERLQDVVRTTALKRALPSRRPDFARVTNTRYQTWIVRNERFRHVRGGETGPLHGVILPVRDPKPAHLKAALASVFAQTYASWELCIADDGSRKSSIRQLLDAAAEDPRVKLVRLPEPTGIAAATNAALALSSAEAVTFLDHDDRLAPQALAVVAAAYADLEVQAVYSDEDVIDRHGFRSAPTFKPGFDYERLLSHNYIGHLFSIRLPLIQKLEGFRSAFDGAQDHDLLLRLSEAVPRRAVRHVPGVLYHWRRHPNGGNLSRRHAAEIAQARRRLVEEHLERRQRQPEILAAGSTNRLVWPLPAKAPPVRVIVPTRDRPDLLLPCAAGILNATDYDGVELCIVDNGSRTREGREALDGLARHPRVTVLEQNGPFNFSALCNAAAEPVREGLLAFVNDDVLIIEPGWLKELAALAVRPNVGAVGAKLYYPDGRIQHAGVVLGLGSEGAAGHEFRGAPGDAAGPQGRLLVVREVSAVTAGCMVVDAAKFHAVGGFDDQAFAVSFNDVDLCLRLHDRGWRTLWTPHARLIHLESATRRRDRGAVEAARQAKEAQRLRGRWGDVIAASGYYHPALSRVDETFSLAALQGDFAPR
jgi:GT2 family glycosyltransferase